MIIILVATIGTLVVVVRAFNIYKYRESTVKVSPEKKPDYIRVESVISKEKKEQKVINEEVIESKVKAEKREEKPKTIQSIDEKFKQIKLEHGGDLNKASVGNNVKAEEVELPKLKFEKYSSPDQETPAEDFINSDIRWR